MLAASIAVARLGMTRLRLRILLHATHQNLPAKIRVGPVMDFQVLPDMGRMFGVLNRKNALFAGLDEGAENWACIASLIANSPALIRKPTSLRCWATTGRRRSAEPANPARGVMARMERQPSPEFISLARHCGAFSLPAGLLVWHLKAPSGVGLVVP
jgi:hypothetical protein